MTRTLITTLAFTLAITATAQKNLCKNTNDIADFEGTVQAKRFNTDISSLTQASGDYTVNYYRCEWNINPAVYYISGTVTAYFVVTSNTSKLIFDLSSALKVDSIYMRKKKVSFSQSSNETLTIQLGKTYSKGKKDSVSIYYQGAPVGSGFGSFIRSTHNNKPVMWTLSEPYGARDWWPCRNGLDEKADSIDIYITHPPSYKTSSNGLMVSVVVKGNDIVTHYKHRYPIASYLVAFAVTNYSVFTDNVQLGNKTMPVISYVYPEDSAVFHSNTHYMLDALQLYSNKFGVYPFVNERYGQTQFGWGGGMEHQTNSYIVNSGTNLMVHELAHQWFGDMVTCASWEDIWLNEGFATYCADFLYNETYYSSQLAATVQGNLADVVSEPGGTVKVDDTTNVDRIFDSRLSYDKGAFLLRMLRFTMGDNSFFAGINGYLTDRKLRYGFAHTSDLQAHLEASSGLNLDYFFNQWFTGEGYPSFTVRWNQDAGNTANINTSQTTSTSTVNFFKVPLILVFKNSTQSKTVVINDTVNNQFTLATIGFKADTVLIDPDSYLISKNNISIKTAGVAAAFPVAVSPNPFTGSIRFTVTDSNGKKVLINLFDVNGHLITSKSVTTETKNQLCTLDVSAAVKPGPYFLVVIVDEKSSSHLVIKQ